MRPHLIYFAVITFLVNAGGLYLGNQWPGVILLMGLALTSCAIDCTNKVLAHFAADREAKKEKAILKSNEELQEELKKMRSEVDELNRRAALG